MKLFTITFIVLASLFIWDSFLYEGIEVQQSVINTASAIVFAAFTMHYYIGLIKHMPSTKVEVYSPMWLNFGVLHYYAYSLWVFAVSHHIFKIMPNIGPDIWMIHNVSNTIKNILFAVSIFVVGKVDEALYEPSDTSTHS